MNREHLGLGLNIARTYVQRVSKREYSELKQLKSHSEFELEHIVVDLSSILLRFRLSSV